MLPPSQPLRQVGQPSIDQLMTRFFAGRGSATNTAPPSEVEPHEVVGGFHSPSKTTWDEATAVFRYFGVETEAVPCPPEWAAFAALDTRRTLVPLAAGFFPQAVRDAFRLPLSGPVAQGSKVEGFSGLRSWVKTAVRSPSPAAPLLAAGIAATLGDANEADVALSAAETLCPDRWQPLWEVQKSAVLAARGSFSEASHVLALSGDHPVVGFNRGIHCLGFGQTIEGARFLEQSAVALPDISGWRHLALLYYAATKSLMIK